MKEKWRDAEMITWGGDKEKKVVLGINNSILQKDKISHLE
jgi:hypothetical protein